MAGWIIKRGSREVPIPDEVTLRKWADEGRFNAGDLIFHPVLQRWLYAQDVIEIREAFQKPAALSTAAERPPDVLHGAPDRSQPRHLQHATTDFIIKQAGQEFRAPDAATLFAWANDGRILQDSYIYHPVLGRWSYARELAELESAFKNSSTTNISVLARNYRQLVLWVGAQILISLALPLLDSLVLILLPALIATIVALALYAFRTAEALGSSSAPLWALAMLVPCVNIITLLVLSSKATAVCRAHGVPVGFLGPRV